MSTANERAKPPGSGFVPFAESLNFLSLPHSSDARTGTVFRNRLFAFASGSSVVVENIQHAPSSPLLRRVILSPRVNAKSAHVSALAWHPHATLLAAGDALGTITIYDVSRENALVASLTYKDYGGGDRAGSFLSDSLNSRRAVVALAYATASNLLAILLRGGILVLFDLHRHQPVYLKNLGEEFSMLQTNPSDARQLILANADTGVFANMYIESLKSEKSIRLKRFQIGNGESKTLRDVRWVGGRLNRILLVLLEREIIVFDVGYGMSLWSSGIRRGLGGFRGVVWVGGNGSEGGSSVSHGGMPARVICRHSGGEVSTWVLKAEMDGEKKDSVGYGMVGWWTTKGVLGGYLEGLDVDASRKDGVQSFVGLNLAGDTVYRWEACLGEVRAGGEVAASLREMRQGLSGRVVCMDAIHTRESANSIVSAHKDYVEGLIVVGTERGFVEVYSCGSGRAPCLEKKILVVDSMVLSGVAWLGKYATYNARRLVAFASQQQNDGQFRNVVKLVDMRSGRTVTVKNVCEAGMIKDVKASFSGAYMLLVCAGMPNELWWTGSGADAADGAGAGDAVQRLRQVDLEFTSVSWIDSGPLGNDASGPASPKSPPLVAANLSAASAPVPATPEEMFAFSLSDARLGILLVKGRKIQDTRPVAPSWTPLLTGEFQVTSCAPSKRYSFLGSRDGTLARWDTTTGATVAVETGCGRLSKVVLAEPPAPCPPGTSEQESGQRVLLALLSSSGTFAVLAVDGDGKFKTTKITWSSGVSSVGYANDVSFYSAEVLMVRLREGGVVLLRIQGNGDAEDRENVGRPGVVVSPEKRRLVGAMVQGGLDILYSDDSVDRDNIDERALWEYLPRTKGVPNGWDEALMMEEEKQQQQNGGQEEQASENILSMDVIETANGGATGAPSSSEAFSVPKNPVMAELLKSRATDDVDSPLYSPKAIGQSLSDRTVFENSMGMETSSRGTDASKGPVGQNKPSVTSKVIKTISTIAKDKKGALSLASNTATPGLLAKASKDRRTALASSLLVPQSPAAILSPRHGLGVRRAPTGISLVEALCLVGRADPVDRALINADFGETDSPARRMAIASRIQWDDKAYGFWRELHQLLARRGGPDDACANTTTTIQGPHIHVNTLGELSRWHANAVLDERTVVEQAVIELVCLGDVEAAVSLLLTSPPEDTPQNTFYRDALCALGLAYSTLSDENSLFAQAARVIAINAATGLGDSLVGIPLLFATGKFSDVVETLQSNDMWLCGAAMAALKLKDNLEELKTGLRAFAEHLALRRGAVWDAVGVLIGGGMFEEAVHLFLDLKMVPEARGLVEALVAVEAIEIDREALRVAVDEPFRDFVDDIVT